MRPKAATAVFVGAEFDSIMGHCDDDGIEHNDAILNPTANDHILILVRHREKISAAICAKKDSVPRVRRLAYRRGGRYGSFAFPMSLTKTSVLTLVVPSRANLGKI